jgi:hypothetical protein
MSKDGEENCGTSAWGGVQKSRTSSEDSLISIVRESIKRTVGGDLVEVQKVIFSVMVSLRQMHPGFEVTPQYVKTSLDIMSRSGMIDADLYSLMGSVFLTQAAYNAMNVKRNSFQYHKPSGPDRFESGVLKSRIHEWPKES